MDIFNLDRSFTLTYNRETFGGEFPTPQHEREIAKQVAFRLSDRQVPGDIQGYELVCCTLNTVLTRLPRNYPKGFDWIEHPLPEAVVAIYRAYKEQEAAFIAELKKNLLPRDEPAESGERPEPVPARGGRPKAERSSRPAARAKSGDL